MEITAEWHPLGSGDLEALCAIAAAAHPNLPERVEVFAEKLRLFPEGCLKFTLGGRMAGYGLSHPWALNSAPRLDAFMGPLPEAPGCLYIHDVALLPAASGRGAAHAFARHAEALARDRGLRRLALVSVYGTARLWARMGFKAARPAGLDLAGYGSEAEYMVKELI